MWHIRRNKKKILWEFVNTCGVEHVNHLQNPGVGWYTMYSFAIEDELPEDLIWCLHEEETIAFVLLDISAYREKMLDAAAMIHFKQILGFFRKQNKDVILRPVYDREGRGAEQEPKTLNLILGHLKQIAKVLQEVPHSVFLVQGALIGNWGEMHGSEYLSEMCLKQLYQCMEHYFPKYIILAVRTPALWRTCCVESELDNKERRLSLFDDALFGSETDLGTFGYCTREAAGWTGSWSGMEELRFWNRICRQLPSGGETVLGDLEPSVQEVIHRMEQMHISYLNHRYDARVIEKWKQQICQSHGIWQGQSLYQYIGAHLGYRFVVENPELIFKQKTASLRFHVKNTGFGACWFETEMELIQETDTECYSYSLGNVLQNLENNNSCQIAVPVRQEAGKFFLRAYRKTDKKSIQFANSAADNRKCYLGCLQNCDLQQ